MTTEQIDRIAFEKGGVIGEIGYGYSTRNENLPVIGDWTAKWINTQGMGNYGTLVLVPLSSRARSVKREGIVKGWIGLGLRRKDAEILYHKNIQFKFELIPLLTLVLSSSSARSAYLAHPGAYGPGSGRSEWQERWAPCLESTLSAPREASLARMVQAVCAK